MQKEIKQKNADLEYPTKALLYKKLILIAVFLAVMTMGVLYQKSTYVALLELISLIFGLSAVIITTIKLKTPERAYVITFLFWIIIHLCAYFFLPFNKKQLTEISGFPLFLFIYMFLLIMLANDFISNNTAEPS